MFPPASVMVLTLELSVGPGTWSCPSEASWTSTVLDASSSEETGAGTASQVITSKVRVASDQRPAMLCVKFWEASIRLLNDNLRKQAEAVICR